MFQGVVAGTPGRIRQRCTGSSSAVRVPWNPVGRPLRTLCRRPARSAGRGGVEDRGNRSRRAGKTRQRPVLPGVRSPHAPTYSRGRDRRCPCASRPCKGPSGPQSTISRRPSQPDMVDSACMRLGCRQDKVERQGKTRPGRARRGPAQGALRVASVLALAPSPRQGRARAALGRRHRLPPIHRRRTQRSNADPHGPRCAASHEQRVNRVRLNARRPWMVLATGPAHRLHPDHSPAP